MDKKTMRRTGLLMLMTAIISGGAAILPAAAKADDEAETLNCDPIYSMEYDGCTYTMYQCTDGTNMDYTSCIPKGNALGRLYT